MILVASFGLLATPVAAVEIRQCFATKDIAVFDTDKLIAAAERTNVMDHEMNTTIEVFRARNCDVLAGQYVTIGVSGQPFVAVTSKSCSGIAVAGLVFASIDCE